MPFIEIGDNLIQLVVTTIATIWAGLLAVRRKEQTFFLLFCGYGCYVLGLLFWLLYLVFMTYTPQIFYGSDLSWIGTYLFFLSLELTLVSPREQKFHPPLAWVAPALIMGLGAMYMILAGEIFMTLIWESVMAACGYFSLRGLLYARKQEGKARNMEYFHMAMLFLLFTEHALFTVSCFFKGAGLSNPYYWFDQLVTVSLILLIPALKKGVFHDLH